MKFPKDKIKGRYTFIKWAFVVVGLAIIGKAFYTMTVKRPFWEEVAKQRERVNLELKPMRGNLLASNGEVLAASILEFLMYMDFGTWEKDIADALFASKTRRAHKTRQSGTSAELRRCDALARQGISLV